MDNLLYCCVCVLCVYQVWRARREMRYSRDGWMGRSLSLSPLSASVWAWTSQMLGNFLKWGCECDRVACSLVIQVHMELCKLLGSLRNIWILDWPIREGYDTSFRSIPFLSLTRYYNLQGIVHQCDLNAYVLLLATINFRDDDQVMSTSYMYVGLFLTGRCQSHWRHTTRSLAGQGEMEQWLTVDSTTPSNTT